MSPLFFTLGAATNKAYGSDYLVELTGGMQVTKNGFIYHVFTANGSLASNGTKTIEVIAIGGGGSGAYGSTAPTYGGGGGAGGLIFANGIINKGSYPVVIGAGGAAQTTINTFGLYGTETTINNSTIIADGGARGALSTGFSGGCGGGAGGALLTGGTATKGSSTYSYTGYGFSGGNSASRGQTTGNYYLGGGGGGTGAAGGNASSVVGGTGGNGTSDFSSWISDISSIMSSAWNTDTSSGRIAGGGGGGGDTYGADGAGGGGSANTGGGSRAQSAGGSGLVIVRYAA